MTPSHSWMKPNTRCTPLPRFTTSLMVVMVVIGVAILRRSGDTIQHDRRVTGEGSSTGGTGRTFPMYADAWMTPIAIRWRQPRNTVTITTSIRFGMGSSTSSSSSRNRDDHVHPMRLGFVTAIQATSFSGSSSSSSTSLESSSSPTSSTNTASSVTSTTNGTTTTAALDRNLNSDMNNNNNNNNVDDDNDDDEYEVIEYDSLSEEELRGSEWIVGTCWDHNENKIDETWLRLAVDKEGKNVAIWGDGSEGKWSIDTVSGFFSASKENVLTGKQIWACTADDYYYLQGTVRGWTFWMAACVLGQWQAKRLGVDPDEAGIPPWFAPMESSSTTETKTTTTTTSESAAISGSE